MDTMGIWEYFFVGSQTRRVVGGAAAVSPPGFLPPLQFRNNKAKP